MEQYKFKEPHIRFLYEPVQSIHNLRPPTTRVGYEIHNFLNSVQEFCRFGDANNNEFDYGDLKHGFEKVVDTYLDTKLAYAPLDLFVYAPEADWAELETYKKDTSVYILAPDPIFDECRKYAAREENKKTGKLSGTVIRNELAVAFFSEEFRAINREPNHWPKGCFDTANSAFYFADKDMFEKMKAAITYYTRNTKPESGKNQGFKTLRP